MTSKGRSLGLEDGTLDLIPRKADRPRPPSSDARKSCACAGGRGKPGARLRWITTYSAMLVMRASSTSPPTLDRRHTLTTSVRISELITEFQRCLMPLKIYDLSQLLMFTKEIKEV